MRFENPAMLLGFWLLPVLTALLVWSVKNRQKVLERFARGQMLSEINRSVHGEAVRLKAVLFILVFVFSIMALARPQWGYEWQDVKRHGIDLVVAVDVSKSMLTQDVKPNRLERTKLAVKDLLKELQGDRISIVAFAGSAFPICPLTADYSGVMMSLENLNTDTIPRGGTNIALAIEEAMKQTQNTESQHKAIIILTDGENLENEPLAMAKQAKDKGIKIYCIGIGTQEGELIRVQNPSGEWGFLKDSQGNFVKSRLNENLLQQIALTTGGIYVRASGAKFGLDLIYEQELSKLEKRDIEAKQEKKYFERFQVALGLALILLIWETTIVTRKKDAD